MEKANICQIEHPYIKATGNFAVVVVKKDEKSKMFRFLVEEKMRV